MCISDNCCGLQQNAFARQSAWASHNLAQSQWFGGYAGFAQANYDPERAHWAKMIEELRREPWLSGWLESWDGIP